MKNEFIRELARFRRGFNTRTWRRAHPLGKPCAVCNGTGNVMVYNAMDDARSLQHCRYCGGTGEQK